jgi:Spy/CpxP family protein refolding chaperone
MNTHRSVLISALMAAALLLVASTSRADEDEYDADDHPMGMMMPGQMGHDQAGMMARMSAENLKQRLGLSDDQVAKIKEVRRNYLKDTVMQTAKVRVAELELNDLLDDKKLDAAKIEKKVKEMESLRGELTLMRVRSLLKTADFLTPEQFEQFRSMTTRRMGGAGMGSKGGMERGKMGPSGPGPHGGQGMMPPGMMKPHE